MDQEFEGVIGYFATADALRQAVPRVRKAYLSDLEVYLPVGDGAGVEEMYPGGSPVRWFAVAGGLLGAGLALWMTIGVSLDYPLVTGGKPIVSLPPFLVVALEGMILFGAIGILIGFLWAARLPDLTPGSAYSQRLAVDTFALLVRPQPKETEFARAERALREAGAQEIRRVPREDRGVLGEVPW